MVTYDNFSEDEVFYTFLARDNHAFDQVTGVLAIILLQITFTAINL